MKMIYVSGSPRLKSNTDILLKTALAITGGEFIKLSKFKISPCQACWNCLDKVACVLQDDMTDQIIPMLLDCDGIVFGSPVYFNNVSSTLKTFMDRTWCLKGTLQNKLGGAVVVGRGYGFEGAITAINAFMLKHEMIPANRGVSGIAYKAGEIINDDLSIESAKQLGKRILVLNDLMQN